MTPVEMQDTIRQRVTGCIETATRHLPSLRLEPLSIDFKLRGRAAGKAWSGLGRLSFNIPLALENVDEFLKRTVPHEVAHVVADRHYGHRCVHGSGWKYIMRTVFGLEPTRCHSYNTENHRVRRRRRIRYNYACACGLVLNIGAKHHNIIRGPYYMNNIRCRKCRSIISPQNFRGAFDFDTKQTVVV